MDHRPNAPHEAELSIPELLQKLAAETTLLVRQELKLAQAEITQKLKGASGSAVPFAIGIVFALGTFGALTATFIIALGLAVPLWASALIITIVYAVIAAVAVQRGLASIQQVGSLVPQQTVKTIEDDVEAVRTSVKRGR